MPINELNGLPTAAADDNIVKGALTWAVLNQQHDCYDATNMRKLSLLLKGGSDIIECAKEFMPRWNAENTRAYEDRLSFASYENNFGEIVNDLGSTLFAKPIAVLPTTDADDEGTPGDEPDPDSPYMQWQAHFTLDDMKMPDFMHEIQTMSNALGRAYYGVDFDDDGKPYAYHIDPLSVLDWEKDDECNFVFIVMRNDETRRTKVRELRNKTTTTFTVWTRDPDTERVKLETYAITYPVGQEPGQDEPVKRVSSRDLVSDKEFKRIPVIECETPSNISMASLIGEAAGSIYMRYTTFLFCQNRAINPILAYMQGAELPANGDLSVINEDEDRGFTTVKQATQSGKAVIGPNDKLEWVKFHADAFTVVQAQLEKDKNELYRLASSLTSIIGHTGVSTAQTRNSGEAKHIDNAAKEYLLSAYAKIVKEWLIEGFSIVFEALGEDVEWQAKGMDNYKVIDADQLIAKVTALPLYKTNMPSKTSYEQVLLDTAYEMHPFANVGVMNKIQEEIKKNIQSMDLDSIHQSANPEGTQEADSAKQLNKAVPQQPKAGAGTSSPKQNAPGGSDMSQTQPQPPTLGETGNKAAPPGSHMQTGQHVDPMVVYKTLEHDYPKKNIAWIKSASIKGPMEIDVNDIDFHGEEDWKANKPGKDGLDKVEKYTQIMNDKGFEAFNPVILANMPHNDEKYTVIDGRHRIKAAQAAGIPIIAYVAEVGSMDEDTPHMMMHESQL